MSFSSDVKEELADIISPARHCRIAELAAIFALAGRARSAGVGGAARVTMRTENFALAKKAYALLKGTFGARVDVMAKSHKSGAAATDFFLAVAGGWDSERILKALKIVDDDGNFAADISKVDYKIIQSGCCRRAFLRGVFMAAGSVTDPKKAYHLEIAVPSRGLAAQVKEIISSFMIDAKIVVRKKYYVTYIKEGEQIVDFLNVIGAHLALMDFENVRIVKEVRNSVNRRVNCETANIGKTVDASARQIEDIKYIQRNMGFSKLSDGLREIAMLRLEHPESSLQELGGMLDRPIGKSGVNHRLRKLSSMADEMRNKSIGP